MAGTFRLGIELGNEAMQGPEDVARALHRLAEDLVIGAPMMYDRWNDGGGKIRDENGNTVGTWDYEPELDTCEGCGRPDGDPEAPGDPCGVCGAGHDY
jgi:hypothetical protein